MSTATRTASQGQIAFSLIEDGTSLPLELAVEIEYWAEWIYVGEDPRRVVDVTKWQIVHVDAVYLGKRLLSDRGLAADMKAWTDLAERLAEIVTDDIIEKCAADYADQDGNDY